MDEKQIQKSSPNSDTSGPDIQGSSAASSSSTSTTGPPSRPSSSSFSLSSLRSFFTTPGPATSTGTVRKMPAFLMIATTALLFTSTTTGSNFSMLPQAHASAIPASSPALGPSTSSYFADPLVSASLAIRNNAALQNSIPNNDLNSKENPVLGRQAGANPSAATHPQPGPIKWNTHCTHPGEEGIWNCMTTTWQRCVQGRWSVVMRSSSAGGVPEIHMPGYNKEEIVCVPVGVSHDARFVDRREAALLAAAAGGSASSVGGSASGVNGAEGPALGATSSGSSSSSSLGTGAMAGGSGGAAGTETKWGGWNGLYWSGGEAVGADKKAARERLMLVLAVAGVTAVMLGLPGVL